MVRRRRGGTTLGLLVVRVEGDMWCPVTRLRPRRPWCRMKAAAAWAFVRAAAKLLSHLPAARPRKAITRHAWRLTPQGVCTQVPT